MTLEPARPGSPLPGSAPWPATGPSPTPGVSPAVEPTPVVGPAPAFDPSPTPPRPPEIPPTIRPAAAEPRWLWPAFGGVLALAAVLYLANLTVSGWANTYYSAAAQAASQSWSAWFFGSFDAANFITVDKPPLSTMLMGLSVRLLVLSPFAVLLPEADRKSTRLNSSH